MTRAQKLRLALLAVAAIAAWLLLYDALRSI